MAPKRYTKKKKTFKKRAFKKRTKNVKERVYASVGKHFPKQMLMSHSYVQNDTITTTSGVSDYQTYSCNNMYDPDTTGTGHQPLCFDQMALLYNHYTVIGSKIEIKYCGTSGGDSNTSTIQTATNMALQIHSASGPTITDPILVAENNMVKLHFLPPGDYSRTVTSKWSAKKMFGGSILANTNLQGSAGGAPTEQSYWTISFKPVNGSSTIFITLQVKITYIALWRELKSLAAS